MWQIFTLLVFTSFLNGVPAHSLYPADHGDYKILEEQLSRFDTRLYSEMMEKSSEKNIIISPFSIQTCLAMTRMGASGDTATEIDRTLTSSYQDPQRLAMYYHKILQKYQNNPILTVANKMYVNNKAKVHKKFNDLLAKFFFSSAEEINFGTKDAAATSINDWVSSKTNNLIKEIVSKDSLDDETSMVLVNVMHFKGEWLYKFAEEDTKQMNFQTEKGNIKVPMMYAKGNFSYGYSSQLKAYTLQMLYKDSDLSMLIILPKHNVALEDIERQLQNIPLAQFTRTMKYFDDITVFLPKFKAEFEIDLEEPLQKMGINRMFTAAADFKKMLMDEEDLHVSSIIHKAIIEINEQGAEAAAVTESEFSDRIGSIEFNANRPFHYIIRDKNMKLFEGNFKG